MKFGLYGGTFDPIHHAHLLIAQYIQEELDLDRVIFIPSGSAPHKKIYCSAELRSEMVRLSIQDNPYFEHSAIELENPDVSYSVDTIERLGRELQAGPKDLFWIMGSDNLVDFGSWREPDRIRQLCTLVVFPRNVKDYDRVPAEFRDGVIYLNQTPILELSSTRIRSLVRQGRSIRYWVVPAVEDLIKRHRLYSETI